MENRAGGEVASTDTVEHYRWGDGCDGWHLVKTSQLSVIQESIPPRRGETWHYHVTANQFFFVLSGVATLEVDNKRYELGPLQGLYVAAGSPHRLRNESHTELVFLVTSSPKSHGDRVEVRDGG